MGCWCWWTRFQRWAADQTFRLNEGASLVLPMPQGGNLYLLLPRSVPRGPHPGGPRWRTRGQLERSGGGGNEDYIRRESDTTVRSESCSDPEIIRPDLNPDRVLYTL
ncbi:uncharacterized protein RHO17_015486 [Thomomys bottae]